MWLDSLGGRKFVLAVIAVLAGCAIGVLSPKGLSTETVALLLGVVAAFNVSNTMVTNKMASGSSEPSAQGAPEAPEAPTAPPVDLGPVYGALNQLGAMVQEQTAKADAHGQALVTMQQAMDTTQKVAKAALSMRQG